MPQFQSHLFATARQLLLALLLVVLLSACGHGDDEPAGPITAVTQPTATGALPRVESPTPPQASATATSMPTPAPTESEPTTEPQPTTLPEPIAEPTAPVGQALTSISLSGVLQGLDSPTYLTHAGDERLFVTEQVGRIQVAVERQLQLFLDITDRVGFNSNEQGLLGLAFHPDYAANGAFYVNYTGRSGATVVSRFQVSPEDANRADPNSEQVLFSVEQPYPNHNGGHLLFGPDSYLYIGLGDGGSGGDPLGHGQNPNTLLGAILRVDVDNSGADGAPYAIPPDNPYVNGGGAPEVWGYGLRNPWRFSFDPVGGAWYIADVGQNQYEEVHVVAHDEAFGANFGWNIMEGLHCFNSDPCDQSGLLLPVVEYSHAQGGCSVTGGYVYRGANYGVLTGNYFFGDYCSGFIWGLRQNEQGAWSTGQGALVTVDGQITSFGLDAQGEIYVVTREGVIYIIQP